MALANYSDLVSAVQEWLANDALSARIPDMITLAESELRRRLHVDGDEVRSTAIADGEFLTLPVGFGGMRSIHLPGSPDRPLEQMAQGDMLRLYAGVPAGIPRAFALVAGQLRLAPVPASASTVEMVYYRDLPALTVAAPTNWLMTAHPDCYLMATMMQAELFEWNDGRLPLIKARLDEVIEQITADARRKQWGAAPVAPRLAPPQMRGAMI